MVVAHSIGISNAGFGGVGAGRGRAVGAMQIRALQVFCDVVRRRSFSRAAEANGMTQSAVSQAVHQLEKTLGVRLIDRSRRPLVPTPEGEVCYRECQELLARWRYLEESFQAASGKAARRVEVASIYSVGLSHMNVLVGRFLKTHPRANVRLQYQHPRKVYRLVEEERVDVGLVSYPVRSRTMRVSSMGISGPCGGSLGLTTVRSRWSGWRMR